MLIRIPEEYSYINEINNKQKTKNKKQESVDCKENPWPWVIEQLDGDQELRKVFEQEYRKFDNRDSDY